MPWRHESTISHALARVTLVLLLCLASLSGSNASGSVTEHQLEARIKQTFGISLPCSLTWCDMYFDGGSIGGTIRDRHGDSLNWAWANSVRPLDQPLRTAWKPTHHAYVGARYYSRGTLLPIGSDAESLFIRVLRASVRSDPQGVFNPRKDGLAAGVANKLQAQRSREALGTANMYVKDADLDAVRDVLRRTPQATVYRIAETWGVRWEGPLGNPETTGVVAGHVALRSEPAPSARWVDSLRQMLSDRNTYIQEDRPLISDPGYVVRLRGRFDSVTVILSADYSRLSVRTSSGSSLGGWTDSKTAELALLIRSALPPDPYEARRESMDHSTPHDYRDRDCSCLRDEAEFVYYEEPAVPIRSPKPRTPGGAVPKAGVRLHVLVDTLGLPCRIKVVSGSDPFAARAVDKVRGWRWKPATSNGKPLCVWIEVPVEFEP